MSKKIRTTLVIIIVLFVAAMALYPLIRRTFFDNDVDLPSARQQRDALQVNAEVLEYQDLSDLYRTFGTLIPDEEVDLSFETTGMITDIYFREGTEVQKGQLLAKVNDKPLQAELKKLEAQIPLAKDRVSRQQALLEKDAVSQESYESVVTDLNTLMADIELVKARIAQTELRAPFDGVIGLRQVSEGAYASPTTVVSRLTKIKPLKIEFSVTEDQINSIKPGTQLTFTVDNDQNVYTASVYAVESRMDEILTLKARALYDNPGGRLKPGRYASIEINMQKHDNTLVIPSIATVAEMGRDIAYVYDNGVARQVEILKGMRTASSVQVIEGLNRGDTLITTGVMQLTDGRKVTIGDLLVTVRRKD